MQNFSLHLLGTDLLFAADNFQAEEENLLAGSKEILYQSWLDCFPSCAADRCVIESALSHLDKKNRMREYLCRHGELEPVPRGSKPS